MKGKKDIKNKRKGIIASQNEIKAINTLAKKLKISFSRLVIDCAMERVKNESVS